MNDFVQEFKFSATELEALIEEIDKFKCDSVAASVHRNNDYGDILDHTQRRGRTRHVMFHESPKLHNIVQSNVLCSCSMKGIYEPAVLSNIGEIQYASYSVGDHFARHIDTIQGPAHQHGSRILSMSINLSDPSSYEGGELILYGADESERQLCKDKGSAIIFPSFMEHEVKPVTAGHREVLVLWIHSDWYNIIKLEKDYKSSIL